MSTAVTKNFTSSSGTRADRLWSASLMGSPKFCSSNVLRNSGPIGSGPSLATMPIAVAKACPARMARESRSSASGNCSSNRFRRRARRWRSTASGRQAPSTAATIGAPMNGTSTHEVTAHASPHRIEAITTALALTRLPDCDRRLAIRPPCRVRPSRRSSEGRAPVCTRLTMEDSRPSASSWKSGFRMRWSIRWRNM
jgi:hypothetical protein